MDIQSNIKRIKASLGITNVIYFDKNKQKEYYNIEKDGGELPPDVRRGGSGKYYTIDGEEADQSDVELWLKLRTVELAQENGKQLQEIYNVVNFIRVISIISIIAGIIYGFVSCMNSL